MVQALAATVDVKGAWMKSVCEDLEMIATSDLFSEFRPCNLHKWVRYIMDHPGPFLMAVKKDLFADLPDEALLVISSS